MKTVSPWGYDEGLKLSRKDEGRTIRLTEDFGERISEMKVKKVCKCCGHKTKGWVTEYHGFRKGDKVKVTRVEHSTDSVNAMGHFEGYAHINTYELTKGKTTIRFSFEDLRVPGEFVPVRGK